MRFHSFLASLLPAEYREQVLGDLHERGFRLRDIVSTIPRVWWSHLRRTCTPPTNIPAGATELAERLAQSMRQTATDMCLICMSVGFFYSGRYRELSARRVVIPLLAALAGYCFAHLKQRYRLRKAPPTREAWLAHYHTHLSGRLFLAKRGGSQFILLMVLIQIAQELWPALNTGDLVIRAAYLSVTYGLAVALNLRHVHRLSSEIGSLQ
jgi:hypothetical protein